MGSSILGTRESLIVAYASLAPSGDHQWATWERRISSGRDRIKWPSITRTGDKRTLTAASWINEMAPGQQDDSVVSCQQEMNRWCGESIKCSVISGTFRSSIYCSFKNACHLLATIIRKGHKSVGVSCKNRKRLLKQLKRIKTIYLKSGQGGKKFKVILCAASWLTCSLCALSHSLCSSGSLNPNTEERSPQRMLRS